MKIVILREVTAEESTITPMKIVDSSQRSE